MDHYQTLRRHKVLPGDILVAALGEPLGRSCRAPTHLGPAIVKADCFRVRPHEAVSAPLLVHWLNSPQLREDILESSHGLGRIRINLSDLKSLRVPVPPEREQRRIVTKLDSLRARSSRARHELDRIPTLIERYKQAILAKAFSGELTADWRVDSTTKWSSTTIGAIAGVGTGATPKRGNLRYYDGGNIPWITSSAVNQPLVTQAEQFITEAAIAETNCKVFPKGTILVAMYGEGKTRGTTSVLGIAAATNQALAAIEITASQVVPTYVKWLLTSRYMSLRDEAAGGVQPNLNLSIIRSVKLPLPDADEQSEIVRRIEKVMSWLDKIATVYARAENLLPKLDQAILAKAFRGELVSQDPNDELASVLMERIRAERRSADTSTRTRGHRKA